MSCTSFEARWCRDCGKCTCVVQHKHAGTDRRLWAAIYFPDCPLHGVDAQHARKPSPRYRLVKKGRRVPG